MHRYMDMECTDDNWMYADGIEKWIPNEEFWDKNGRAKYSGGNMYPIKTVKGFKTQLYKISKYLPEGLEFKLTGRFVGVIVTGKTKRSK